MAKTAKTKAFPLDDAAGHRTKLDLERDELAYSGSLHWFHWLIVILSAVLTITAWQVLSRQIEQRTQAQFEREVTQTVDLVAERMRKYEDALWSGVAALQANDGRMKHLQWRTFTQFLELEHKYPGIGGRGEISAENSASGLGAVIKLTLPGKIIGMDYISPVAA